MAGRVGNEGYSYFSETAYKNLKEAIDLLIKYQNIQHRTSLEGSRAIQSQLDKQAKYANQLKEMGVALDANVEHMQREYELETEIYKAQIEKTKQNNKAIEEQKKQFKELNKEKERGNILSKFQRDFQNKISDISEDEIKHRKALNNIMDEANDKAKDLRLSEESRNKILDEYTDKYKKLNQQYALQQRQTQAKKDFRMSIANTLTGVTSQDIADVKEGTFGLKLASKVFAEAVNKFANAVKTGIDKNFNTIEGTLNRITASNNMSWSKGSFSFGNKTYNGFSNVNNAITDQLKADGLYNNIANTDVMEATAKLTSSGGMNIDDAIRKGYQDTVIKYIVPYLDTATEAFESAERLIPRNIKIGSRYCNNIKRAIW